MNTIVGLAIGIPAIVGALFALIGRTPRTPVAPERSHAAPDRPIGAPVTFRGAIHEGLVHLLINPGRPLWEEILSVLAITAVLVAVSAIWVRNMLQPVQLAWDRPLWTLVTTAVFALALVACALWAKVFLKMDYLNRR